MNKARSVAVIVAIFALAVVDQGLSRWGPGESCAVAQPAVKPGAPAAAAEYRWVERTKGQLDLMRGGKHVGSFDLATGVYLPVAGDRWGAECDPPIDLPASEQKPIANYGVNWAELFKDCPAGDPRKCKGHFKLMVNGEPRQLNQQQSIDVIEKGVPDDRNKIRVTVIGSQAKRDAVCKDIAGDAELSAEVLCYAVGPDHWSLKDLETGKRVFHCDSDPTVYVQRPDGHVLARLDGWDGPANVGVIRKVTKPYDPSKDPDPRMPEPKKPEPAKPDPKKPDDPNSRPANPMMPLAGLGALLLAIYARKQHASPSRPA